MKYQSASLYLTISLLFSSCALTSGLQTYDLPEEGLYKTEQGSELSVIQLTQNNIPEIKEKDFQTAKNINSLFSNHASTYRLAAGDVLSIQLWAYPELTPPIAGQNSNQVLGFTIDQNGDVFLPLIGRTHLAGKTLGETNALLRSRYSQYLKHPDVIARMLSYEGKRYFVNGQVERSGQYNLNDQPISLYTALSQAGGVKVETGDNANVQLIRNGQTYDLNVFTLEKQGLSLHKLLIQPNDTIYVGTKQNQKIYVLGESNKSKALEMREQGMTLSDVIGESEGINPNSASAAKIYVMRTDLDSLHSSVYQLNLRDFGNFGLANQFQMKKNDIVYIDATGLTRWQRIVGQIVPFAGAVNTFQVIGNN